MLRGYRLYLEDMAIAIGKIQRFIGNYSFDEFIADEKTFDAVIRNLEIIGEAAHHIPQDIQGMSPSVEWKKVYLFKTFWLMSTSVSIAGFYGTLFKIAYPNSVKRFKYCF